MNANIKKYREDAIKQMVDDIKYMENNGIDGDDLWEGIDLNNYSYYSKEEDKVEALCNYRELLHQPLDYKHRTQELR